MQVIFKILIALLFVFNAFLKAVLKNMNTHHWHFQQKILEYEYLDCMQNATNLNMVISAFKEML